MAFHKASMIKRGILNYDSATESFAVTSTSITCMVHEKERKTTPVKNRANNNPKCTHDLTHTASEKPTFKV